jgi:hypothetical protein
VGADVPTTPGNFTTLTQAAASRQVGFQPIGWNHPAVQDAEPANWRHQGVPFSSIYLDILRGMQQIAGSFADLPNAVCFLCSFQPYYATKDNEEMHK